MLKLHTALCLLLSSLTLAQRWEPFPTCLSCIPQALLDAPGIGFDLSGSYGTIAVRFNNGSNVNIAKVEGDEDYKLLMRRLMGAQKSTSSPHRLPSYKPQEILDSPIKPNTSHDSGLDIHVLSNFIKLLRSTTESYLDTEVDLAVATHSSLPFLQRETLQEAFNRANMTHLGSYKVITRLDSVHQVVSGLAGLGHGMCEHWNDSRSCENEDKELLLRQVFVISLTDKAFVVSNTAIVGPHLSRGVKEVVHWDLGFWRWRENPKDLVFWRRVREAIENVPVSYQKPDLLLLLGDSASLPKFQDVVKEALENMDLSYLYEEWETKQHDSLYLAARGAAEITKVWQGSEWNCRQRWFCSDERPKDDGEGVGLREMWDRRARWNESCMMGDCPWNRNGMDREL